MIVRINQFDPPRAEPSAGWPTSGLSGPLKYSWPGETHAFELLILDRDESQQILTESFRQKQLRQLIPDVVEALREHGEEIVARLDGPLSEGEVVGGFEHIIEPDGAGRYAFSAAQRLEEGTPPPIASLRLHLTNPRLSMLMNDANIGFERLVRLRIFSIPSNLVSPFLDTNETDDERWSDILNEAGVAVSTVRGLQAVHLLTRRYDPIEARTRLMQRLVGSTTPKPAGK
ncbi:MAG TPA: hypothetical protein VL282_06470 [Tepidisphaeraceae bacterium]|jgi:hypothetical protein|nr:hypothetical protein [Tepidisphaeraceae bacterium]